MPNELEVQEWAMVQSMQDSEGWRLLKAELDKHRDEYMKKIMSNIDPDKYQYSLGFVTAIDTIDDLIEDFKVSATDEEIVRANT